MFLFVVGAGNGFWCHSLRSHRCDGGVMAREQPGAAFCQVSLPNEKKKEEELRVIQYIPHKPLWELPCIMA